MTTVVDATRAELDTMPAVAGCAVAVAALDLAARLDDGPADTTAVLLVRELRQCMAHLAAQSKEDVTSDLDRFLAGVSTPAFNPGR